MDTMDWEVETEDGDLVDVTIVIDHWHHQEPFKGSPHHCDSDMDYYGFTECDWHVEIEGTPTDDFDDLIDHDAIVDAYKKQVADY
jgi:hypothetical protein